MDDPKDTPEASTGSPPPAPQVVEGLHTDHHHEREERDDDGGE